jgi:hypothetical protein
MMSPQITIVRHVFRIVIVLRIFQQKLATYVQGIYNVVKQVDVLSTYF